MPRPGPLASQLHLSIRVPASSTSSSLLLKNRTMLHCRHWNALPMSHMRTLHCLFPGVGSPEATDVLQVRMDHLRVHFISWPRLPPANPAICSSVASSPLQLVERTRRLG